MLNKRPSFPIILVFVMIFVLISSAAVFAQEDSLLYFQDFNDGWPDGWEAANGWEVIESEKGLSLSGSGHNWVSFNSGTWEDYSLHFNIKLEPNAILHANYRLSGGPTRYFIGITPEHIYLSKQTGADQFFEGLAESNGIGEAWTRIEISGHGPLITVYANGQEVFSYTDPDPLLSGGVAFESLTEGQVLIDDVEIWGSGDSPPTSDNDTGADESVLRTDDPTWVRLGGPPGGLGYDIRYKFDNPDTWYVTDANAGVHISTDNGQTWHQSNQGIDTVSGSAGDGIPIFSLTVDPHNSDILWIGTDHSGDIYRSEDGGVSWVKKSTGIIHEDEILLSFRGFTVHPHSSEIVYAMGELQRPGNNVWGQNVGGVVYKTTDSGDHWTRIWNGGIPSSLARYMWINPDNPDILYVSTGIFDRGAVGELDVSDPEPFGGLGILKSVDGGLTWRILGKENGLDFLYIGSLFMHPDNPDILFAAAGKIPSEQAYLKMYADNESPMGIYRTENGGESWQQVLKPEGHLLVQTFSSVDICPSNPDIIYAGSDVAIYRSSDGGDSWKLMAGESGTWGPPGVRAGWPIDMQCDPRDPDRVFADNYSGGAFLSEDKGKTWENASSGYSGAQIIGIAVDPFDPARVFAAGRSGAWYSTDGGTTWSGIHNPGEVEPLAGGEWGGAAFDPVIQNHILLGGEILLEWHPDNNHWEYREYQPGYGPETSEIEFAPSDPQIIYAVSANHNTMIHAYSYESGRGIILSRDGGSSWEIITGEQFKEAILTDVSVDYQNPSIVYVASQFGLYKSSNSGMSWANLVVNSPGEAVRSIAVHPTDSNRLYAGLSGVGFYISDDGGNTWNQVYGGLEPNGDFRDIVFDLTNPDNMYLADITSGVYQSIDNGESWIELNQGLTNRAATTLSLSRDSNHLYAGTAGGGVFRLDLSGSPPAQSPALLEVQEVEDEVSPPPEDSQPTAIPEVQEVEDEVSPPPEDSQPTAIPELFEEKSDDPQNRKLPCLGGLVPLMVAGIFYLNQRKRAFYA